MFLGLLDPDPDPSVRGMDPNPDPAPDPDPSITKQKSKKNLDSYCFVTFFDFLSLKMMYKYLQKVMSKKVGILRRSVMIRIRIRIRIRKMSWIRNTASLQVAGC
jgi:hypothetical protein